MTTATKNKPAATNDLAFHFDELRIGEHVEPPVDITAERPDNWPSDISGAEIIQLATTLFSGTEVIGNRCVRIWSGNLPELGLTLGDKVSGRIAYLEELAPAGRKRAVQAAMRAIAQLIERTGQANTFFSRHLGRAVDCANEVPRSHAAKPRQPDNFNA